VCGADLILLATPPATIVPTALEAAKHAGPRAVFTDVGSVKGAIVSALGGALPRFVPAHPVAGTEKSGPAAAMRDLFRGRRCILTPTAETDPEATAAVREMWEAIGANVVLMTPELHDWVCAAVSHLPHAAAYALTGIIGELAERWPEIYGLGAGGFTDTTRIASSHPQMWRDIFLLNRQAVLDSLDGYLRHLSALRALVAAGDAAGLEALFARMREVRARALQGTG
jgi:prephenate dehydrogenase